MFHVFQKIGTLRGLDIFTMQFSNVDRGECARYLAGCSAGGYITSIDRGVTEASDETRDRAIPNKMLRKPPVISADTDYGKGDEVRADDFEVLRGDDLRRYRAFKRRYLEIKSQFKPQPSGDTLFGQAATELGKLDADTADCIAQQHMDVGQWAAAATQQAGVPLEDEEVLKLDRCDCPQCRAGVPFTMENHRAAPRAPDSTHFNDYGKTSMMAHMILPMPSDDESIAEAVERGRVFEEHAEPEKGTAIEEDETEAGNAWPPNMPSGNIADESARAAEKYIQLTGSAALLPKVEM